jgi:vacuolar protein-sorting-associated protein 4
LRKKVDEYLNRAEELKKAMAEQKNHKAVPSVAGKDVDSKENENDDAETKKMQNALSSAILSEKPNVRWDDIAGLESAKEALKEAVILPIKFPHLFSGKRTPWKGILLYGVKMRKERTRTNNSNFFLSFFLLCLAAWYR